MAGSGGSDVGREVQKCKREEYEATKLRSYIGKRTVGNTTVIVRNLEGG